MRTLGPEVEEGGQLPALVVAAQHVDRVLELYLDCQDESQHLDGEAPAVHVVPQEEVLGGLEGPASVVVDDLDEVVELAVNVAHDSHWVLDLDHVGLLL